jgi:tRNA(Ile)-lysidine synthase
MNSFAYSGINPMKRLRAYLDVASFFQKKKDFPFIFAMSGGSDSTALFHLLLAIVGPRFHVAHVDHQWSDTSESDARILAEKVDSFGLPFHLGKLDRQWAYDEDRAREGRYTYFETLARQLNIAHVVLAHQQDDLAETSLKRCLEGACLSRLGGMRAISKRNGIELCRPLLYTPKKEVMLVLNHLSVSYLNDLSNLNDRYLRVRMRQQIFPDLEAKFGKQVRSSLAEISKRSWEVRDYLHNRTQHVELLKGPFGEALCLHGLCRVEARFLMNEHMGNLLSRSQEARILVALEKGELALALGSHLFLDRGVLFHIRRPISLPSFEMRLTQGSLSLGGWHIRWSDQQPSEWISCSDWQGLWKGCYKALIPECDCLASCPTASRKGRVDSQVPRTLLRQAPYLMRQNRRICSLLSIPEEQEKRTFLEFIFEH